MRILIVEDEQALADAITELFRDQHYEVDTVYDGKSGLEYALIGDYALIILDVMLPLMDGFAVVKSLRQQKISTPVLMLTAREAINDKITGLDCGADDYMTKPFDYDELFARVRALTRRVGEVVLDGTSILALDKWEFGSDCTEFSFYAFGIKGNGVTFTSPFKSKGVLGFTIFVSLPKVILIILNLSLL